MNDVAAEFRHLQEQKGKKVEVVEVSSEGERVTWGILCDFRPYSAIDLFLAQGQVQTGQSMEITQTCPFAGVFSGIKRICDEHGHELYRNEHLAYHKKFYDCWHNAEDNRRSYSHSLCCV